MDLTIIIDVLLLVIKCFIVTQILLILPIPLTWFERKVAGHIQQRPGPMRVGPHGIFQPIADAIKLMFKEDIVPRKADKLLFMIAPLIAMIPAFAVFVTIPVGDPFTLPYTDRVFTLHIADFNVGVLYILAIGGLGLYGFIFGGWASNSKYALMGGLRTAAQMISYEVALSFACIGVVMMSNTLSLVGIVEAQKGGLLNWNIFYLPVGPVWFIIFLIAGIAEINRIPFDLPEDEGALAAGYQVEYSAMRFSFFALAEYVSMTTISVLIVIFFLGGWTAPVPIPLPPMLWFIGKVGFFIYFFMWLRFTLPRYRYDQLMNIGWKILIPLSLVMILVTGLMKIYL